MMKIAQVEIPSAKQFGSREDLIAELKANTFSDATILVKASRGVGLEAVVDYL